MTQMKPTVEEVFTRKADLSPAHKQARVRLGGAVEASGAVPINYLKPLKR